MIRRFIFLKSSSQTTFLIMIIGFLKNALGFFSQMIIAHQFGAKSWTDAYFISLTVPLIVGDFMIGGALMFAVIPSSIKSLEKGGAELQRQLHTQIFLFTLTVTLCLFFLYRWNISWLIARLAKGFDHHTLLSALRMAHTLSPMIILLGLQYLFSSIFLARKKFYSVTAISFISPAVLIFFCLFMKTAYGDNRLIHGALTGCFLQTLVSFILVLRSKLISFHLPSGWSELKPFLKLTIPVYVTSGLWGIFYMQQRHLAVGMHEGAVSALAFATTVNAIPMLLLFSSLNTVLYPKYSEQAARREGLKNSDLLERSLRFIVFLAVPIAAFMMVLRKPITQIIYERGAFTASHTLMASSALGFMLLGLFAQSSNDMMARAFYAEHQPYRLVKGMFLGAIGAIGLNPFLSRVFGIGGISLASSFFSISVFMVLIHQFQKMNPSFNKAQHFRHLLRTVLRTVLPVVLLMGISPLVFSYEIGSHLILSASSTILLLAAGFSIYFMQAMIAKEPETKLILSLFDIKQWRHSR